MKQQNKQESYDMWHWWFILPVSWHRETAGSSNATCCLVVLWAAPCCISHLQAIAVQAWRIHIEWCSNCYCRCPFLEDINLVSTLFSMNFFPLNMQHKSLELTFHLTHVNASGSQLLHHASHDHCVYISQVRIPSEFH